MPRSIKKEITTVTIPITEKKSKNNDAVTMKEASINPNITRNIVEIIIPDVHTQPIPLNVPYANMKNKHPKTNHVVADIKVPKKSIGYNIRAIVDGLQERTSSASSSEYKPHIMNIKLNRSHNKTNM